MKKTLSIMLTLIMLVCSSMTVLAEEEQAVQEENSGLNVQVVDEFETKVGEVDVEELTKSTDMSVNAPEKEIHLEEGAKLEGLENVKMTRSASGSTQSVLGTIANEGEYAYSVISLNPNEAINVTLECPKNPDLDYDLFLYEVDSEGYMGNMLTGSSTRTYMNTYPDGTSKTLDEAFAYTNKTTEGKYYAIIVLAVVGGSTTDTFKLTLSVIDGSKCDIVEPNDNPYDAYELPKIVGGATLSKISLHIVNDQDWFLWRAPYDAAGVEVSAKLLDVESEQFYNVEVYKAEGNKMILASRNGKGAYRINPGVNYIRVFADEASFTESSYELDLAPWSNTAAKINVRLDGDEGDQQYAPYPGGTYFRFKNRFCPEIQILSESGYLVRNQLVTLTWKSGAWAEHTGNSIRKTSGRTNDKGRVVLTLAHDLPSPNDLPIAIGEETYYRDGSMQFIHHYDIDGILIEAGNAPIYTTVVYHLAHSEYAGS